MPIGINPGVYVDIVPETFIEDTAGAITSGLFFLFSRKGVDNHPRTAISPKDLIQKYGTPDLYGYGQGLYNAYNFSRVSSDTRIFRVLPNIEDTPTTLPLSNTYQQMPATFANSMIAVINSSHATDNKLLIPISFIPNEFIQKPEYAKSVYENETQAPELLDTDGHVQSVTKSTTILTLYKGEYTDITSAGFFNNTSPVAIQYSAVREALYECGYIYSSDPYVQNFLANGPTASLTILPGSRFIPPIVNYYSTVSGGGATVDLTGTGMENAPFLYVRVNGVWQDPATDYTWTSPTITFTTALNAGDTVEVSAIVHRNSVTLTGPAGNTVTIPASSANDFLVLRTSNGEFDYGSVEHLITRDPNTGDWVIKNLSGNTLIIYYDNFGYRYDYIRECDQVLVTFDSNGLFTYTKTIIPDYVAQTLGYSITVLFNGVPANFTYNTTTNTLTVTGTGTPGTQAVLTICYTQVNDPLATVNCNLIYGFHGIGRGGWYNKLALKFTPIFEDNGTQLIPSGEQYNLTVYQYDKIIGDYIPTADFFTFGIYTDSVDEFNRPINLEHVVNNYGTEIFVYQNDQVIDNIKGENASDPKYQNKLEQIWHLFSQSCSDLIPLKGGSEGCVKNLDGSLYWTIGTAILVNAIQGVYDNFIYNTDEFLVDLVYDADYPDVIKKELINFCELRQDCVAILDVPKYPNVDNVASWHDNTFATSSFFAALFTPHVKVYNQFDKDYVWMAPSYIMSYVIPFVDRNYGFWQPPAGKERGKIPFDIEKFAIQIQLIENDADHQKLVLRNINPLGRKQGLNVVWGDYTTYKVPSALQSLHVARIVAKIYRELRFALSQPQWDLITPALKRKVKNIVLGVLSNYIGSAIENDVNVDVQFSAYDRMQRLIRVYVDFKPYLELRRVYLRLVVR